MKPYVLLLFLIPQLILAQEALKKPIVLIQSGLETGSGLIVGQRNDRIYILTASHVIDDPSEVKVMFRNYERKQARIHQSNDDLDIAVIACDVPSDFNMDFTLKASEVKPAFGEKVIIIGHPDGNEWDINRSAEIKELDYNFNPEYFTTSSAGVRPGSSGAPIFNERNELLGMVQQSDAVKTICIASSLLSKVLKRWVVPQGLVNGDKISSRQAKTDSSSSDYANYIDDYAGEMVYVKGGTFEMGSEQGGSDEKPVHKVQVSDFFIGKYEVTVAQFKRFVDESNYKTDTENNGYSYCWSGSDFETKSGINWRHDQSGNLRSSSEYDHPVIYVSWNDAQAYAAWISEKTGKSYQLPSEAQWEYAARGGIKMQDTNYAGSNTLGDVAWHGDNSNSKTHPIGKKTGNELGLHDMSGNVYEWCLDAYDDEYYAELSKGEIVQNPVNVKYESNSHHVLRGGSWYDYADFCRVAYRLRYYDGDTIGAVGFRLSRTP